MLQILYIRHLWWKEKKIKTKKKLGPWIMTRQCSRVFCFGKAISYLGRPDLSGPWAGHPDVFILHVTHTMHGLQCIEARNTCTMCHHREKTRARAWRLLTVSDGISWPSGMVASRKFSQHILTFRVIQAHSDLTEWADKSEVQTWR